MFGLTQSVGADGGTAATLGYALDVTGFTGPAGVDSGLNQGGNNIYLYEIGGKVVGSTSARRSVLPVTTVFAWGHFTWRLLRCRNTARSIISRRSDSDWRSSFCDSVASRTD